MLRAMDRVRMVFARGMVVEVRKVQAEERHRGCCGVEQQRSDERG